MADDDERLLHVLPRLVDIGRTVKVRRIAFHQYDTAVLRRSHTSCLNQIERRTDIIQGWFDILHSAHSRMSEFAAICAELRSLRLT